METDEQTDATDRPTDLPTDGQTRQSESIIAAHTHTLWWEYN